MLPDSHESATTAPSAWEKTISPGRFASRTVVVTGAGSSLGRAVALGIAHEGGRVIAGDISADWSCAVLMSDSLR